MSEQVFLALSKAVNGGAPAVRTVQFEGSVCGHPVLVLIDSRSSTSFISKSVAVKLSSVQLKPISSSVQVAGGGILCSEGILQQVPWSIGPCSFVSDFRVLELQSCDVIIGMDWLSSFSLMQIHWEHKWIALLYNGQYTVLQGMSSQRPATVYLQVCQLID